MLQRYSNHESVVDSDCTLQFLLAGNQILITGIPKSWPELMPEKYRHYHQTGNNNEAIHISLKTSGSKSLYPSAAPHDLNESSSIHFEEERVLFDSDWCQGSIELATLPGVSLVIHKHARASFPAVLENILRMLMAYLALSRGGVLLHSAAITRHGNTAVLFGHSGAGKSTISELALAAGCEIVSDDINILLPGKSGWEVHPVPFSGTFRSPGKPCDPTRLTGLYRLEKASYDVLTPCTGARAISLLSGSSAFVNCDPFRTEQLFDVLSELNRFAPAQELEFTKGPRFLQHVFKENFA